MASRRSEKLETILALRDEASDDLIKFADKLAELDGEEAVAYLEAEAKKARKEIRSFNRDLASVDGAEAEAELKAEKAQAERDLSKIESKLRDFDGSDAEATIEVDSSSLDDLIDKIGNIDGPIGDIGSKLSKLASPAGAVAGLAGGLLLVANKAASAATEVGELANLTGDSTEEVSRLLGVASQVDIEMKDLADVILQMNGVLADSPELAEQLGINLDDGKQGAERFVEVADKLNTEIDDAFKRGVLGSKLFGEEGVRQVNALIERYGSLRDAVDEYGGSTFSETDIERAKEFKQTLADLQTELAQIGNTIGQVVLPAVGFLTDAFEGAEELGTSIGHALQTVFNRDAKKAREEAARLEKAWELSAEQAEQYGQRIINLHKAGKSFAEIQEQLGVSQDAINIAFADLHDELVAGEKVSSDYGKAQDLIAQSIDDATAELEAQEEALQDARKEMRRMANGVYDVADAQDDLERAVEDAYAKLGDQENAARDDERALRDVARSADSLAQKQVELEGETLDTESGMKLWNESMLAAAETMGGPMREEVAAHILRVNGIPETKQTEISALLESGNVEGALSWLARERSSPLNAFVKNGQATEDYLAWLSRQRSAYLTPIVRAPTGSASGFRARGGPVKPGGAYVVGEEGPELITPTQSGYVHTASETASMLRGGRRGGSVTIIQNLPTGVHPTNTTQATRRYARIQGSL